ncbi:U24-ctenitoxin-Pn1a-like [Argiope bruennichi]|uniref:U24-ctenitoxin-Pn1a-like n=1 Tax=Argiope bruennichi TaxID=94029 RepID=UPI00249413CE|nr:U24-ctenitoxin-Pn1a-like [Argiope bruennichi]
MKNLFILLLVTTAAIITEAVRTQSDCQIHRNREMKSMAPLPMRLIPNCDKNGDYLPMQCFQNSKFCRCYSKDGDLLTPPSTKLKSCDCIAKKNEMQKKNLSRSSIPQCNTDGTYKKS